MENNGPGMGYPSCPGPAIEVPYCGCDGRTFTAGGPSCPPGPYAYEGACGDTCGDAWLDPDGECRNDDGPVDITCCDAWLDGGIDAGPDGGDGGFDDAGTADGGADASRDGAVAPADGGHGGA